MTRSCTRSIFSHSIALEAHMWLLRRISRIYRESVGSPVAIHPPLPCLILIIHLIQIEMLSPSSLLQCLIVKVATPPSTDWDNPHRIVSRDFLDFVQNISSAWAHWLYLSAAEPSTLEMLVATSSSVSVVGRLIGLPSSQCLLAVDIWTESSVTRRRGRGGACGGWGRLCKEK